MPYLFLPLVPGFGEHLFVFMPADLLFSFLDHTAHDLLQYLSDAVTNQSTITLV